MKIVIYLYICFFLFLPKIQAKEIKKDNLKTYFCLAPIGFNNISRDRIKLLSDLLKTLPDNIVGFIVFGSVANGTATEKSDLDYIPIRKKMNVPQKLIHWPLIKMGFPYFVFRKDVAWRKNMEKKYPFFEHGPMFTLFLDSLSKSSIIDPFLSQIVFQKKLFNLGSWRVIARTTEEEKKITKILKIRIRNRLSLNFLNLGFINTSKILTGCST